MASRFLERTTSAVSPRLRRKVSPKLGIAWNPPSYKFAGSPSKRDCMSEAVTAYAYRVGEAVAAYILDPALLQRNLLGASLPGGRGLPPATESKLLLIAYEALIVLVPR